MNNYIKNVHYALQKQDGQHLRIIISFVGIDYEYICDKNQPTTVRDIKEIIGELHIAIENHNLGNKNRAFPLDYNSETQQCKTYFNSLNCVFSLMLDFDTISPKYNLTPYHVNAFKCDFEVKYEYRLIVDNDKKQSKKPCLKLLTTGK